MRNLIVVLGDQLNRDAAAFDGFDASKDVVWMAEVDAEATQVWSHKQRIALFLSAMRHFRSALRAEGIDVEYTELQTDSAKGSLSSHLAKTIGKYAPEKVIVTQPGEWRVLEDLKAFCSAQNVALEVREDRHFYVTLADFREHAKGRKAIRMEFFYRQVRKQFKVLMEDDQPVGGEWNYDKSNRKAFPRGGPEAPNQGPGFAPDTVTEEVLELVAARFSEHPGTLDSFAWPVTAADAQQALADFVKSRLPNFGDHQDAMWTDEPWLYHSLISTSLNLKLLNPRDVVAAAEQAYQSGSAPLPAVEGFIRQILGWREYVRGIYWLNMPGYVQLNKMEASEPLPEFYWTVETDLVCLNQAIGQTLEHGYAHHIQRLMVTGLYGLLLGIDPQRLHEWYLAVYVDAVEWVELPNTLGMSQYADGGLMASKPYIATGNYINKMSNYCKSCPKNPKEKTGEDACPFTTLYWDYLIRHQAVLGKNHRMGLQLRNLDRIDDAQRDQIVLQARTIRDNPAVCFKQK